ncbi:hypothetical protein V8F20_003399 [Naviculisporaceae sp. PSN 640]
MGAGASHELLSVSNGLLLHQFVETAMDDGAIAVVPNLPDDPTTKHRKEREAREPKQYRWRMISYQAKSLTHKVTVWGDNGTIKDIKIRELDGRRTAIRTDFRTRARYLYYLSILSPLKLAWGQKYKGKPDITFGLGMDKEFGASRVRYLRKSVPVTLPEELGHSTLESTNMSAQGGV